MGMESSSSKVLLATSAGAASITALPALDSVLSRTLSVSGLTLLIIVIGLKSVAMYRHWRRKP